MSIDITFSIDNPLLVAGIEHARDRYNADLPPVPQLDEEGNPIVVDGAPVYVTPHPQSLTSEQYAAWIGRQAAKSWAREHQRALWEAGAITLIDRDAALSAIDAL